MAIPTAYLSSAGKVGGVLNDVQRAGVPDKFTYEFLKQLGYQSSSDRPVIAVMKALGFLTDSGQPTDRYRRFKDTAQSKAVLAEAIRDAYSDVFTVDQEAHKRTVSELKGIFARLSGKGESVNEKMAQTFKALADLADFASTPSKHVEEQAADKKQKTPPTEHGTKNTEAIVLRHDVHIHLPISTDIAVYDAIFRSLRENLG